MPTGPFPPVDTQGGVCEVRLSLVLPNQNKADFPKVAEAPGGSGAVQVQVLDYACCLLASVRGGPSP